ncbi:MAG: anaerobic C4-dicarboxylate transporter [Veillonella sp.]|nr:anaerobic C4-dicarboxylate transporter [Veillonella sp.]
MDLHLIFQVLILFGAIFLGVRLGGMGIGYAGGLGVVALTLIMGMAPGQVPWDVILIIMSAISVICAMQLAGGLDYLVRVAEKILRKKPKYINYLAPAVTYMLTLLAGTGHTAFSMIPVIVEVAKGENIKPSVPLSISVVASQIAITASPVSAAVVAMSGFLEPFGVSYPLLLALCIPTTFLACMITAFIMSNFCNNDLSSDKVYQERLAAGTVEPPKAQAQLTELKKGAKLSVGIFFAGVVAIVLYATAISKNVGWIAPVILGRNDAIVGFMLTVLYATAISKNVGWIDPVVLGRNDAIVGFMLTIATLIAIFCKIDTSKLVNMSTFKSGLSACVCVLGVAWLGDTFVKGHIPEIKMFATSTVELYPFLLAVVLFFASMLLYSQAATTQALIPTVILALGITPENPHGVNIIIASFAAVSALFVLPTYPTLLGAVQMDDTGSTRIGRYIFNHSFFVPGVLMIALAVGLGFVMTSLVL